MHNSFFAIFPSVMLPMFLAVVDQTLLATALPAIALAALAMLALALLAGGPVAAPWGVKRWTPIA